MTTKIELRRMTFYAYHGVAPQETRVGNTFIVDLILTAPLENAVWSDDLSDFHRSRRWNLSCLN